MTTSNNNSANNSNTGGPRSNRDLVGMAFRSLNSYKRHRALAESARKDNRTEKAIFHDLKQYKDIDSLELALRAIQKGLRELEELNDESDDE